MEPGRQFSIRPIDGFRENAFEAHVDDHRIGSIYTSPSKHGGLIVNNIQVDAAHRRQGIATTLYKAVSDANGGAPIDHVPSTMSGMAKRAVGRLSESQPGLHRKVTRDVNGNSRVGQWK